jgi:hypothetical protein
MSSLPPPPTPTPRTPEPAFHDLGLSTAYAVEINPEFPGTGTWREPVQHFHLDAKCDGTEEFRSPWGPPIVARITPDGRQPWIAMVESEGVDYLSGLYASPKSTLLLVINGGTGYLIDVTEPGSYSTLGFSPITSVSAVESLGLILMTGFSELGALDTKGLLWTTERLVWDDLTVVAVSAEKISITGSYDARVDIDPRTGEVLGGSVVPSPPWFTKPRWMRDTN